jgi:hypothetical protein
MGVCLEPTPSMGPYSVEIRSQSFYLNRLDAQPDAVTQPDRYELTVPIGDTAMIIAALDQVVRHPNWSQQPKPSGDTPSDTAWTIPPGSDGPAADSDWSVAREGSVLRVRGPWVVYYEPDRGVVGTEIAYSDLRALRDAVSDV